MPELTHSTMFKYVPPICVCYYGALRKRAERMRSAYYARGRRLLLTHHLLLQAVNLCLLVFFSCLLSASFSSLLPLGIYMLAATYSRSQVTAAQLLVPKVHLSYHGLRRFLWRPHINKSPWDFRQHPPPHFCHFVVLPKFACGCFFLHGLVPSPRAGKKRFT